MQLYNGLALLVQICLESPTTSVILVCFFLGKVLFDVSALLGGQRKQKEPVHTDVQPFSSFLCGSNAAGCLQYCTPTQCPALAMECSKDALLRGTTWVIICYGRVLRMRFPIVSVLQSLTCRTILGAPRLSKSICL